MSPQRIQRRRTKGWRMPENTVYVGRGTKWGNPYKVGDTVGIHGNLLATGGPVTKQIITLSASEAVTLYELWITHASAFDVPRSHVFTTHAGELAGKNLACWCPLDQPCHADVLLELANQEATHA